MTETEHRAPTPKPQGSGTSRAAPQPPEESPAAETDQGPRFARWHRHDLAVVVAALALFAIGGLGQRALTAPARVTFHKHGLELSAPGGWVGPKPEGPPPTHLARELRERTEGHGTAASGATLHESYTFIADSSIRLEVRIAPKPRFPNLRRVLSFDRHNRYGELYRTRSESNVPIRGRDWLRAEFEYAYKAENDDSPGVAIGIEYAVVSENQLYAVTFHGELPDAHWLESEVAGTLAIPEAASQTLLPLPGGGAPRATDYEAHIQEVLPAVVMVLALDLIQGELVPVAGGSGIIISSDGSVLTNHHVLYDEDGGRLHDLFVIGRIRDEMGSPECDCAGHPTRAKRMPDRDLALLKCDLDMSGRPWTPENWPTVRPNLVQNVLLGERIWVVGFPNTSDGRISVATGEVSGSTSEGNEVAFIRTTASISQGSSGGAAIDGTGALVGVASAFRLRSRVDEGGVTPAGKVGLIRPIRRARPLIELAERGWTPVEGEDGVPPLQGDTLEAVDPGVLVSSRVVDARSHRPVPSK